MSDIYVIVENEDASITDADLISSGDVNAVKAHFTFTENWDEYPIKTMFVYSITKAEENRIGTDFIGIDSEGIAIIPKETLSREGRLFLCVIGQKTDNEDVLTSTRVTLKIRKGFEIEIEDEDDDFLSRLLPAGGEQGEFLVKNSDNDFDYGWGKPDVIFDTEMSDESEHGVQNKVIKAYVDSMASGVSLTVFTINPFGTGTTVTCNKTYEELSTLIESNTFVGVVKSETLTGEYCFMAIDEIVTSAGTKLFYAYSLKGDTKYKCVITTTSSSMSAQWTEIPSGDEYTAGDNIDITNNVISADIVEPIVTFTIESTMTTPPYRVSCDTPYSEIMERYNADKLKVQAYIHEGNNVFSYKAPMTYIYYGGGDTKFYFEYLDGDNTVEWEVVKTSENNENYTVSKTIHSYNYTAGDGIRINQREVSVKAPDTFNVDVTDFTEYTFNDQASMYAAYGFTINQLNRINSNNKIDTLVALATEGTETTDDITCAVTGFNYESEEDTETANHHTDYYKIYFEYINTAYELTVAVAYTNDEADNYKVKLTEKSVGDIYALRKYYGNENINLGNNNGVPANTFNTGAIWNEAIGVGNTITGQYNEVGGNNNNINGSYNNITGYGLYVNGQFNVAFGPIMPEAKKLQGMCNIVTAYGNDVSGDNNAVFGNNNKARGSSHLIAGHGHDVQGYNNLVTGEYSTVNGSDNAVFGINYGTIQGSSNIVNGYYTYVKPRGSGSGSTSEHNIIGGAYHTVSGSNNLVVGEQTSNDSFTFPDDEEATTFDHVNGYDNIYSGFMSSITGRHNILTASYAKILGDQNLVMGEHHAVKGAHNILTGSGGDGGFVGSNNIAVLGGYGSVINGVEYSNILSGYTIAENLRYAALNTFYSRFQNAQYINANGYGLKFSGTLDENDYYTNPNGLTIIGQWNEDGNDRNDYVFVVGGGTGDDINRKNVFTITTDGQVTCTVNNQKHTIFGSSCVTDELPQTGQEDTLYVLYEEEGTDTTDTTDDTITVLGMYIWKGGEYFALPNGGGGTSYIAGDGISIRNNTISIDNIEVVNSLPAQGTENIFYQVQNYEQTFTLDGEFPTDLSTQSNYESWNMGGRAMMLCVDTSATTYATQNGIKYVLLTGITANPVATASGGQDVYYQVTQVGSTPMMYTYSTTSEEWTESPITQIAVNDYLFAVGSATGITPENTDIIISDSEGSISNSVGLEWMSGNDTSNEWSIEYRPSQYVTHTYTYADNAYEIYTGNPYVTSVSMYVYKNGEYTSLSGGSSYIAGNNITITGNVISADITEQLVTFTIQSTGTTPPYSATCATSYSDIIALYNANKLKVQAYIHEGQNVKVDKVTMTRIEYNAGIATFYFEYYDNGSLIVWTVVKSSGPNENYTVTKTTVTLDFPSAEGGGF